MARTILVTGASGFVGRHLLAAAAHGPPEISGFLSIG